MTNQPESQPVPAVQPPSKPPYYLSFTAEISPATTEGLLRACTDIVMQGHPEIHLLMSTPGGNVTNGIHVYHMLRALPCKVVTHNVGAVNSIGNVVFLAGAERYANPSTTFMFHGVGFDVQNARLEERILRERLDSLLADQTKIADIIRARASFSDPTEVDGLFLQAATKDADYAKARGIIHDVREAQVPKGAPVLQLVFKR